MERQPEQVKDGKQGEGRKYVTSKEHTVKWQVKFYIPASAMSSSWGHSWGVILHPFLTTRVTWWCSQWECRYLSFWFNRFPAQFVHRCPEEKKKCLWMVFLSLYEGQTGLLEDLNYFVYFNLPVLAITSTHWVEFLKKPWSFTRSC